MKSVSGTTVYEVENVFVECAKPTKSPCIDLRAAGSHRKLLGLLLVVSSRGAPSGNCVQPLEPELVDRVGFAKVMMSGPFVVR